MSHGAAEAAEKADRQKIDGKKIFLTKIFLPGNPLRLCDSAWNEMTLRDRRICAKSGESGVEVGARTREGTLIAANNH
jgi:hypothetical protein